MVGGAEGSVYTVKFWMLCASSFLFSSSFNMLIPELPAYLSSLGGSGYKGYIIGLFTITAGLSRPFSGRLTDTIGRNFPTKHMLQPLHQIKKLLLFFSGNEY